jgi:hypothetical protein
MRTIIRERIAGYYRIKEYSGQGLIGFREGTTLYQDATNVLLSGPFVAP